MDSSSIVSFNNDSTFQTTLKGEYSNVSVHELALHAMRDRCLLLQRRINTLETDNMRLKLQTNQSSTSGIPLDDDEKVSLHQKIAELTKQKSQLMHHVFMVSCENKNLWNKISSIKASEKSAIKDGKHPLVRTNTYIQSTPRTSANYQEKFSESSLEDISLKLINSYIQEKSQLVEQYEQMTQLQDDDNILNMDSIGFAYFEDHAPDSLKELQNQTEKLHNMKKELDQQESDLKLILSNVETAMRDGYKCPTCVTNNTRVVTSENKEIETSDSLVNWATPADSTTYNNLNDINTPAYKRTIPEDKETAETFSKICPMCGQTFQADTAFTEFQTHVEKHFMGESEMDSDIDNFENINSFDNVI